MAVNLANPVNWQSPLNRGLKMWHVGADTTRGRNLSADIVGGFVGTFTNTPSWVKLPNGLYGLYGGASPYVTVSHNIRFKSATMSVACWVYVGDVGIHFHCPWSIFTSDSDTIELFCAYATFTFGNYVTGDTWVCTHTGISANTWYYVYCETNGTSRKMWVNGLPANSTPTGTSSNFTGASNTADFAMLARPGGGSAFTGAVGDMRVTNGVAISDDMAMRHYNAARMRWVGVLNNTRNSFLSTVPSGGSFKSAWVRGSNVILQPGVLT